jgi:hypothetical protein
MASGVAPRTPVAPRRKSRAGVGDLQGLLVVVSAELILYELDFGDWAVGAYIVLVAEVILLGDAAVAVWLLRREKRRSASRSPIHVAPTGG